MKKICSVILALSLMMSMIVSLTACSNKVKSSELTMWIGESVVGENEFEMPQDSWIVQELVNEYSTIYGTHIKLTYFEDEEAMIQLIANNARMGNEIPDVACVFSSENIREMTDVLYPLTNDVTEEEKEHIMFWETVMNGNDSGEIYGFPFGGTEVTFMAYNKSIFRSVGIDVENHTPENISDFNDICEKLSESGILPIVGSDGGWNELYLKLFSKEWLQNTEEDRIISEGRGEEKYSDDVNLLNSLSTMKMYYDKGYINADYPTNEEPMNLFATGRAAMYCCSNFDIVVLKNILGSDFGVFETPNMSNANDENTCIGGCNQCLTVLKNSPNINEAVSLVHWLSTKENAIRVAQKFGCFPNRNDIDVSEYSRKRTVCKVSCVLC